MGTLQVRKLQLGSLQVREDTAGGDNMKEDTTVGITHSAGRRPQDETHSGGSELLSASPCLTDCPAMGRKQGCVSDPRSSRLPGLTLNSELSQHGSSTCIPAGPTYDGGQGTVHSDMLPQPERSVSTWHAGWAAVVNTPANKPPVHGSLQFPSVPLQRCVLFSFFPPSS